MLLLQPRHQVAGWNHADGDPGRVREILDGRRRQAAAPEEGRDLAVLQRSGRLRHAEALPRDVAIGIEAGRPQHADGDDLGAASRGSGRHDLPRRSAMVRMLDEPSATTCV